MNAIKSAVARISHLIAHLFGQNGGTVETFWRKEDGRLMVGFRCHGCGALMHVSESATERLYTKASK